MKLFPVEAAQKAWKMPEGFQEVEGRPVFRDNKMCAVADMGNDPLGSPEMRVLVFPRGEHIDTFSRATQGVREAGPAMLNPGAVGTMAVSVGQGGENDLTKYFQAHYRTAPKKDLPMTPHRISRPLATRYAGWRDRALKLAVHEAEKEGKKLTIIPTAFIPPDFRRQEPIDPKDTEAFAQVQRFCAKENLEIHEEAPGEPDHLFVLRRKGPPHKAKHRK